MAEQNHNLWAPWRMEYIHTLEEKGTIARPECFLCAYAAAPAGDGANRVIWRTDSTLTVFNKFPYSNGHLLVAPTAHLGDLSDLSDEGLAELFRTVRDAKRLLARTAKAQGFNVGMNFGRCAGAGLPDHLHVHIVPRWEGDTNFMPVLGDTRVIPQSMDAQIALMRQAAGELGLPEIRG
jgi:ATP adenylyltransferase